MNKKQSFRLLTTSCLFSIIMSLNLITHNYNNSICAFFNIFNRNLNLNEFSQLYIITCTVKFIPLIGSSFVTSDFMCDNYETARHYIFTRMGSKFKWYLYSSSQIAIYCICYMIISFGIYTIFSLFSVGTKVINKDFINIFFHLFLSYALLAILVSLITNILSIYLKSFVSLLITWSFIFFPTQIFPLLINNNDNLIKTFPISSIFDVFYSSLVHVFEVNDLKMFYINLGKYTNYSTSIYLLTLIIIAFIIGYIVLNFHSIVFILRRLKYGSNRNCKCSEND